MIVWSLTFSSVLHSTFDFCACLCHRRVECVSLQAIWEEFNQIWRRIYILLPGYPSHNAFIFSPYPISGV